MEHKQSEPRTEGGSVTESLPDCARQLARLRSHYPIEAQHHISNLIEQCRNYQYNPQGLRPQILRTIERLSAFIKNHDQAIVIVDPSASWNRSKAP